VRNFWRGVLGVITLMGMHDAEIDDLSDEEPLLLLDQDFDEEARCLACGCPISECQCFESKE